MFDDIPIVPNLYEAPSNPQAKDCYYNITLDKYYVYDGTQWLEAKLNSGTDNFELKYSTDGGQNFTILTYESYDSLINWLETNKSTVDLMTDVRILSIEDSPTIIPRKHNTDLNGVALIKGLNLRNSTKDVFTGKYSTNYESITESGDFYQLKNKINSAPIPTAANDIEISMDEVEDPLMVKYEEQNIVGRIYPKIIFNQKLVEHLNTNNTQTYKSIFDGVLVFYEPQYYGILTYIDSNNNTVTTRYDNFQDLKTFITTTNLDLRDVSIIEGSE